MRNVRVIPASRDFSTGQETHQFLHKRRVAGYARVSTDSDNQAGSYEAQVDYYTTMIKNNPKWEFVDLYTDAGISGTSTTHRDGFKQMIADALSGKIDLIVTKSVSRFARNTVDSLLTIRQLKEHNVDVYFEKEGIKTFDSKGELLITIMSSLDQEESRSISENVKWGRCKRFADGKVSVPFTRFLGYDKGPNDNLVVNSEQAKIVRYVYSLFLKGTSYHKIAKLLTREGYKTVTGGHSWHPSNIQYMLTNEKYKGDALLQNSYTDDFLTKKDGINNGEIPQYYVSANHDAIITPVVFDLVQIEVAYRRKNTEVTRGSHVFSGRIRCGNCGGFFGPKIWHSNSKYRKVVWQCNEKYSKKGNTCNSGHIAEDRIKEKFIIAVNELITDKDKIISDFNDIKDIIFDTTSQKAELEQFHEKLNTITHQLENLKRENASAVMDQHTYTIKFEKMLGTYHGIKE